MSLAFAAASRAATTASSTSTSTPSQGTGTGASIPSFSRGLFLGKLHTSSVYPYPVADALAKGDSKATLELLLPTAQAYFAETNNAAANDDAAAVPPEHQAQLAAMGAFGMQVPEEYEGAGLNNTGYARMVEGELRF